MKFTKLYADNLLFQSRTSINYKSRIIWVVAKPFPSHYILDRIEGIWDVITGKALAVYFHEDD